MDFLKEMEKMTAEELCDVYQKAKKLLPTKTTPENFGYVIENLMNQPAGILIENNPKKED